MSLVDDLLRELEEAEGSTSAAKKAKVPIIALAGGHIEGDKMHAYREAMIQSWEQQYCYTCPLLISQSGVETDAIQASSHQSPLLSVKCRPARLTTAEHIRLLVEEALELYGEDDPMVIFSELDGIWEPTRLHEMHIVLKEQKGNISLIKFFLCASPSDTATESSDAVLHAEVSNLIDKKILEVSYFTEPKYCTNKYFVEKFCNGFTFKIPFYFQIGLRLSQLKKFFDDSTEEKLKFFEVYLPIWAIDNINYYGVAAIIHMYLIENETIGEFIGWSYFHRHTRSVEYMCTYFSDRFNKQLLPPLNTVAGFYIYLVFRQKMLCNEFNYEVVEDVLRGQNISDELIESVRPFVEEIIQKCDIDLIPSQKSIVVEEIPPGHQ